MKPTAELGYVCLNGLYKEDYLLFVKNVRPFDYTAFAASGKVGLTSPGGWLLV